MATFTPYLNLEKPTTSERLDVLKINSNWDKIDAGVSALNSQLFTNQADTTLIDLVKTFNPGTYNFRLDNATDAPVSSGGVVYKVVKTHGTNDTRCIITAMPMSTNNAVYSAFVGQNATSIVWTQLATSKTKSSTSASATLKFTYTGTRYTALVFKTDNLAGNSGIYAITYRTNGTTTIDKLSGSSTLPTVDSDGSINVAVNSWSSVTIITDVIFEFT